MAETKRVTVSVTSPVLSDANLLLPMEYKNMSDFIVDAMKLFIEEKKKLEVIEMLKNGYKEMSQVNLKLAEIGLEQDIMDLAIYEANLKRCEMVW